MKKYIIGLLFLLPAISFASIDVNLSYGSHGPEVTELQEFLIDKGFLTGTASGNFYTLTRRAVASYQKSVNLPTSGFVGPLTREKINGELALEAQITTEGGESVTTPSVTPSTDTAILQKQLEMLRQQMAQLTEQQKAQGQQTNQTLNQIQQNTAPVPVVIPPPVPTSVPTTLKVIFPNTNQQYPEVMGANCEPLVANVSVLDQFGVPMKGQTITLTTTDFQDNESTNSASGTTATDWYARFAYKTPTREGTAQITFKSGDLNVTSNVHIRDVLTPEAIAGWNNDSLTVKNYKGDSNAWLIPNGMIINPVTRMCI